MNSFIEALVNNSKSEVIPEEYNYFGPLVGEWDFDYIDHNVSRVVKGEWIFSWVLEGTAIQDVFICPSRDTRLIDPQPDGEYGTTFRIYNPEKKTWDISYCCTGNVVCLEAIKQDSKIVLTQINNPNAKWVFCEINEDNFHWQNVTVKDDGSWYINVDIFAKRKV